jgi:8-oxo-dGTP diphosphatase
VAAYGLVLEQRRILLCRISDQLASHKGRWTLPGGGIEFGEEPAAAMVREVREETGLDVRAKEVADVNSVTLNLDERIFHGIRIVYRTRLLGGSLANEIDGTTDLCAWWSLEEAHSLPLVDLVEGALELAFGS